jgi:hypothetical protein
MDHILDGKLLEYLCAHLLDPRAGADEVAEKA